MIPEMLTAIGGLSAAALPAAMLLRRMRAQLVAVRTECAVAKYDATHDRLTGLLNRAGLEAALAARAGSGRPWALIMVDLDGFKQVNDTFGHDAGDEVLVEASFQLSQVFDRPGDVVGRLGGDEFLVLTDVGVPWGMTPWVRALQASMRMRKPVVLELGQPVTVTISAGVVRALPGAELARVQRSADVAVYRAKTHGGDRVVEYGLPGELATVVPGRPGGAAAGDDRDRSPGPCGDAAMTASVMTRPLAVVPALAPILLTEVPARIARRARLRGLPACDVCTWPVAGVALVAGRTPRHPGCLCCVCAAPLRRGQLEPGVVWHPQCRRTARPALTVAGGAR
jgi:diguanylate cyclase (GGDEF)-like protein